MTKVKPHADVAEQQRPAIAIIDGDSLDEAKSITTITVDANFAYEADQQRTTAAGANGGTGHPRAADTAMPDANGGR